MKVVILAGGFGTRISEESHLKPKPMIEIGERPILWHIMKIFSYYGHNDFIICCGYKQHLIKEWFADYYLHNSDITFDFTKGGEMKVHSNIMEPWKVTLVDTGIDTMTGGRIKRVQSYIGNERFMLTYGDGVADINLDRLLKFHIAHGKTATLTSVDVRQRFGVLTVNEDGGITAFDEKCEKHRERINGGFMVLEPEIFSYLSDDSTVFEKEPMSRLALEGNLMTYYHTGFWKCMDTQRDKKELEDLWSRQSPPWKLWK